MSGSSSARSSRGQTARAIPSPRLGSIRRICGYAIAVVLPWLAAYVNFRLAALHEIRMALNFVSIAAIATVFGLGPAAVSIWVSILAFNYYLVSMGGERPFGTHALLRSAVVLIAGSLITLVIKKRLKSEGELRTVLEDLQEQADALMRAQQASQSAAWTFSTETRRTRWFEGGAEIFGRPHAEITALGSPTSLVVEEDRPKIAAAAEHTIRTGEPFQVEFRVVWPNGELHWLEARGVPLASNPKLWRGATIDITDRKQAEAALMRTEKLAVAGRLAASIAHEINNPLEAVTNLCYLAKISAVDPECRSYIEMAEKELGRVAQITSQTLRFHRQQSAAMESDVGEILGSVLDFFRHKLIQANISVELECETTPPLFCYTSEMRQVFANLIGNAVDAMPDGGKLRLRLRFATDWRTNAASIRVTIADTGHGMSAETRKRIYEPFYTTKGDVGTGLGLWVTAGIVEKHHGKLSVRSAAKPTGGGSAFSLVLPYSRENFGGKAHSA